MSTKYISPTGNDSTGDGSEGNPWQTLSKAIASSSTNDLIILQDGTYTLTGNVSLGLRTFRAQNTHEAIIDCAGTTYHFVVPGTLGTFGFDGIVFQNASFTDPGLFEIGKSGVTLEFNDCYFRDIAFANRGGVAKIDTSAVTMTFNACLFDDLISSMADGIVWANGSGVVVDFNNCTVYLKTVTTSYTGYLVVLYGGAITLTLLNTIMSNETGQTVRVTNASASATYCCFHNITSAPAGTGVITDDPLFIDPASGNFRLRPDSPCLNVGVAL